MHATVVHKSHVDLSFGVTFFGGRSKNRSRFGEVAALISFASFFQRCFAAATTGEKQHRQGEQH